MDDLRGANVLITGAAGGLGHHIASAFGAHGARQFVSSLAGRGGNAYNALYASSKAGLLGLGRSLRAELDGAPVGCSVICPGFIAREGMYPRMQAVGASSADGADLGARPSGGWR